MAAADAEINVGADGTAFANEMKKMAKDVDTMANSITARLARLGQAFAALKGFGSLLTSAASGIKDAAMAVIKPAAQSETLALSFEVLLGSEKKALDFMEQLNSYAEETPFFIEQISNAAKVMLANTDMSTEEIMVRIKQIGNLAALTGQSMEDLASLYARAVNMGVNSQIAKSFETAGIGIRKTIADLQGITVKDVAEKITAGELSIVHLNAALDDLTKNGGKFDGATTRLSKTFEGLASTIEGKATAALVKFGERLLPNIEAVMERIITAMDEAMPAVERMGMMFGDWLGDKVQNGVLPAIDDLILQIPELGVQMEYAMAKAQEFLDTLLAIPNAIGWVWEKYSDLAHQVADWLTYENMTWEQAGKHAQRVKQSNSSEGQRDRRLEEMRQVRKEQREAYEARRQQRQKEAQERDAAREEERQAQNEERAREQEAARQRMAADEAHTKSLAAQKKLAEDNARAAEKYADAMERYDIERAQKKYDKLSIPAQERSLRRQGAELGVQGSLSPESIRQRMDALAAAGAESNKKELDALQRILSAWDSLVDRKKEYAAARATDTQTIRADALETLGNDRAAQKLRDQMELEKRIADLRAQGATKEQAVTQATMESKLKQARAFQERLQASRVEFIQGNLAAVGGGGGSLRLGGATLAEAKKQSSLLREVKNILGRIETKKTKTTAVLA